MKLNKSRTDKKVWIARTALLCAGISALVPSTVHADPIEAGCSSTGRGCMQFHNPYPTVTTYSHAVTSYPTGISATIGGGQVVHIAMRNRIGVGQHYVLWDPTWPKTGTSTPWCNSRQWDSKTWVTSLGVATRAGKSGSSPAGCLAVN